MMATFQVAIFFRAIDLRYVNAGHAIGGHLPAVASVVAMV